MREHRERPLGDAQLGRATSTAEKFEQVVRPGDGEDQARRCKCAEGATDPTSALVREHEGRDGRTPRVLVPEENRLRDAESTWRNTRIRWRERPGGRLITNLTIRGPAWIKASRSRLEKAGHSLAGEASRGNDEGAEELEESRSLRWVDKSSNGEEP